MGKIIAIANQKGGVGKTTTAINLSAALAEKEKKTLLIDLDSQGNATSGVGIDKNELEKSVYELISGEISFEDCVKKEVFENLDILPANADLTALEIELLDIEERENKLKEVVDAVKEQYEYIIIDCPPSLNMLTVNSLVAADSVLIPIQCEYYALEGLSQLLQTINIVKERVNNNLKIEGIVFTMYDPRVRLSGQVVQNVKQNLPERTFKTLIPRNVRLAEAPSHGKPVMHYAKICSGTRAYRNLAKEIISITKTEEADTKEDEAVENNKKEIKDSGLTSDVETSNVKKEETFTTDEEAEEIKEQEEK